MSLTNDIKSVIKDFPPEDKFKFLTALEDCINTVRVDLSKEWTYCTGCKKYVKVSDCKTVQNNDNTYDVTCGTCGTLHYINRSGKDVN